MPIIDIQRRLHQAGRIRLGDKQPTSSGKMRPAKLSEFRFTSSDQGSLDQVAATYGGDVVPWDGNGSGDKFELYTAATVLNVLVPPVDLAFSQFYEDWTSGVCRHRCDGIEDFKTDHACSCDPEARTCLPTTRLGVILQEVSGIGIWRLETRGWSAAAEIGGTIELLRTLQTTRPVPARLMLREDTRKVLGSDGKVSTNRFVVPVLDPILSVAALTGGSIPETRQLEARGVTPIPSDDSPLPSVASQIAQTGTPVERPKRSNAAPPIPTTGIRPRTVSQSPDFATEAENLDKRSAPRPGNPDSITEPQNKMLQRLFSKADMKTRDEKLAYCSAGVGRVLESSSDLSKREASDLISALKRAVGEEDAPRASSATLTHTPSSSSATLTHAHDAPPPTEAPPEYDEAEMPF